MESSNADIAKAIRVSQHCQRNWDLTQTIPAEDLELLITAATECPSKQNIAYYRTHFVTDRKLIEQIHDATDGFTVNYAPPETTTNTQVLANLVVVFESQPIAEDSSNARKRNQQTFEIFENKLQDEAAHVLLERDRNMAVGIAAGYLNLIATMAGYATGCCACFDSVGVTQALSLGDRPLLLMGIGYKNHDLGRRVHHKDRDRLFPTHAKQKIVVHRHF